MTRNAAFNFAKAEINSFGFNVKAVNLSLPDKIPVGTFYAFFENDITGEALLRTYLYEDQKVSFVKVKNFSELKKENPLLVENYLENGVFLYRDSTLEYAKHPKCRKEGNLIIPFFLQLRRSPA